MAKVNKSKVLGGFKAAPIKKKASTLDDAPVKKIHKGTLQKSTIQFPEDLHTKLKIRAFKLKVPFRILLIEYLEKSMAQDDRFLD